MTDLLVLIIDTLIARLEARRAPRLPLKFPRAIEVPRCALCRRDFRPRSGVTNRIVCETRLDRFLAARKVCLSTLIHALSHVTRAVGAERFTDATFLTIRKGMVLPTPEAAEQIRVALESLLAEPVALSDLFAMPARQERSAS